MNAKDSPKAQVAFKIYIEGRSFSPLPQKTQFEAMSYAAFVGLYHGDKAAGYAYLRRSVDVPEANARAWIQLLQVAVWLNHDADANLALMALAQRWPDALAQVDDNVVTSGWKALSNPPADAQFDALTKLYASHFKLKWGAEPSQSWRNLTLLLLERKNTPQAIEVSGRITDSKVLMSMRIERIRIGISNARPVQGCPQPCCA